MLGCPAPAASTQVARFSELSRDLLGQLIPVGNQVQTDCSTGTGYFCYYFSFSDSVSCINNSMSNETGFFPQEAHIQWETKQVKPWLTNRQQKKSSPASPALTSSSDPLGMSTEPGHRPSAFCPPNASCSIFPEPAPTSKPTTHQSLPGPCSLPSPPPLNPWHPWLGQFHRREHALPCTTGCPGLKQANLLQ